MRLNVLLFAVVLLILFSCKSRNVKHETTIEEVKKENSKPTNSIVKEIVGAYEVYFHSEMGEIIGFNPMVNFEKLGKISGFNGCNRFFGQFLPNSGDKVFDKLGSTRMACQGEKQTMETLFMSSMRQITDIQLIDSSFVSFISGENVVMKARKVILSEGYRVISFKGKEVSEVGMKFDVIESEIIGSTGCNSFFGQLTQEGYSLKISNVGASEMVCQEFDTNLESEFLRRLPYINRYSSSENILTFYQIDKEVFKAIKE